MKDLQAKLASLSMFKALDAGELASLVGQVQWLSVAGGWTLITEGDEAHDMFVVLSGWLGVFKQNAEGKLELINQVAESGATVGEMALLSNERRSATIIAFRNTELVRLSKQVFEELVSRCPKVLCALAVIATERLRNFQSRAASHLDNVNATRRVSQGIFRRTGEYWTVIYEQEECLVKDGKGLHYVSCLLRHPGRDIHALDLVAMAESAYGSNGLATPGLEASDEEEALQQLTTDKQQFSDLGDAGEMLDVRAKQAYKRRLVELREELNEAKQQGDEHRGTQAEDEILALTYELRRAVGLRGRDRRMGSACERARLNVTRSIKAALERISESSPKLGVHLKRHIHTGEFCCYRPDPNTPINWQS